MDRPKKIDVSERWRRIQHENPPLFILSGRSGSGKTTVADHLIARASSFMRRTISCTTREPRRGERHGIDYYFCSTNYFGAEIAKRGFLEHAEYGGALYGTLMRDVASILVQGCCPLLVIEVAGHATIRRDYSKEFNIFSVFLDVPEGVIRERLNRRRDMDVEKIEQRIRIGQLEVANATGYTHSDISNLDNEAAKTALHILGLFAVHYGLTLDDDNAD